MKLEEMKELPKKAGEAKLQFGYKGKKTPPLRIGKKIILPGYKSTEFFPLQNGKQFLLDLGHSLWFGGTDENVFLVRLNTDILKVINLEELNEKDFYKILKPEIIQEIEKRFNVKSKRQGDIWAVPIKFSIKDLVRAAFLFWGREYEAKVKTAKRLSILKTRHRLTGKYILNHGVVDPDQEGSESRNVIVGEGIVKSPNHSAIKLQGLHILTQTAYLWDSTKAD